MIDLAYGDRQQFRYRHGDINVLGRVPASAPSPHYRLNGGPRQPFYVEPDTAPDSGSFAWNTPTPAVNRFRNQPGAFNLEIPIDCPQLRAGANHLEVHTGCGASRSLDFDWNPTPLPAEIDLTNLTGVMSAQEVGQAVNGVFEVDTLRNTIRASTPVASDALFLIGSPQPAQEATYEVQFAGTESGQFLGLSDFFVRHEVQSPELGIKPGYSSAGLATITRAGRVRAWLSCGDSLTDTPWAWVRRTEHPRRIRLTDALRYRVRHQSVSHEGVTRTRVRIWPIDTTEPRFWLCAEDNRNLPSDAPRHHQASFGLFQFWGAPTEWSNIRVQPLDAATASAGRGVSPIAAFRAQTASALARATRRRT